MKQEDLAPFADCLGLRRRMLEHPGPQLSEDERLYLLERARRALAFAAEMSLVDAGRVMFEAGSRGDLEVRAGAEFAAVFAWGRILQVATRAELRGVCHPDSN